MKLIFCHTCADIFNLTMENKSCKCGSVNGNYLKDGLNAEWSGGIGMPFMINSNDFKRAVTEYSSNPTKQVEIPFRACTIPYECKTLNVKGARSDGK